MGIKTMGIIRELDTRSESKLTEEEFTAMIRDRNNGQAVDQDGNPYYEMTPSRAIAWYRTKLLTLKGLLMTLVEINQQNNTTFTIPSVQEFCIKAGITERAYYKTRSQLLKSGELKEEDIYISGN